MNKFSKNHLMIPLTLILALLAALLLATPAFAEEGELPPAEPPAGETQETAPAEDPAPAEAQAPAEPQAPAPLVEAPADPPAGPEAPMEGEPEPPAEGEPPAVSESGDESPVAAQSGGGGQVSAQYNTSLTDNGKVYYYDALKQLNWSNTIGEAITAYQSPGSRATGMIYVSFGEYGTELSPVNISIANIASVPNPTGLVFLDYYPTEATKFEADPFNAFDPESWPTIYGTVTITNLPTFTLLGFNIVGNDATNGVVQIDNSSGSGALTLSYLNIQNTGNSNGLKIERHTGTIKLETVRAASAGGDGAWLGAAGAVNGAITITNSGFNANLRSGLTIVSSGLVTLNGVSASGNGHHGVDLQSRGAVVKNSVFSNNGDAKGEHGFYYRQNGTGNLSFDTVQFNNNFGSGLYVDPAYGNVTLIRVKADNNGQYGAFIDACHDSSDVCQNPSSGNVSVTSSSFENNGHDEDAFGLNIKSAKGSITLNDVWALNNGDVGKLTSGAKLDNHYSPTKSPVSITNSGFTSNFGEGLLVDSRGAITLKDISATNNQGGSYGARLTNKLSGATAGVTLLASAGSWNSFNENQGNAAGLYIETNGAVVLNSVEAGWNTNGADGVQVNNLGSVTIRFGSFDYNGRVGLVVNSKGNIAVTLTDGSINHNGGSGVYLDNSQDAIAKTVILDGGNYFNNGANAIEIRSKGAVTVRNVDVGDTRNDGYGLYINNRTGSSIVKPGVTVTATRSGWTNNFHRNQGYGLLIESDGAIIVSRTNANENGFSGADLMNQYDGSSGSVTVSNAGFYNNNQTGGSSGLKIRSRGNIILTNVSASNNFSGANGASLDNYPVTTPRLVSITNGYFNDNAGNGLDISSIGAVTLTNVQAGSNAAYGLYLTNNDGTPQPVTINGGDFSHNQGSGAYGAYIYSKGAVTLRNVHAHDNANGGGLYIRHDNAGSTGNVSVSCTTGWCDFNRNGTFGAYILSKGSITLNRLDVVENGYGMYLRNDLVPDLTPKNISISNSYIRDSQTGFGLDVESKGAITLTNVDAGANQTYGARLNNTASNTGAPVTITGQGDWDWYGDNGQYGIRIQSKGSVTIRNINASGNQWYGLLVLNSGGTAKPVSITNAEISRNVQSNGGVYQYGLYVVSAGAISLTNVWVNENGFNNDDNDPLLSIPVASGAYLATESSISAGITLTNVRFDNNYGNDTLAGNGLDAISNGAIVVRNLAASNNRGYGASLNNRDGGYISPVSVTRTGASWNDFNDNQMEGLNIRSNGAVSAAYINASNNQKTGLFIDSGGAVTVSNGNTFNNGKKAGYGGDGVYIRNNNGAGTGALVSVSYLNAWGNGSDSDSGNGLVIEARGAVALNTVTCGGNFGYGVFAINNSLAGQNITLARVSAFNNRDGGMQFTTGGNVIASNLVAISNSADGVRVTASESGSVTLNGASYFNGNNGDGLKVEIQGTGSLSLTGVTTEKNAANGVSAEVSSGTVSVLRGAFNYNTESGLLISANNTVTLTTLTVLNNGTDVNDRDGVRIVQNNGSAKTTITGSVLTGNAGSGLDVELNGGPKNSVIISANTIYFGNDRDGNGDKDVNIQV